MNIILGGGLAGLTAGYRLSKSSLPFLLIEREADIGGLSRTITYNDFRFDIGGHRFLTHIPEIEELVRSLLKDDLLTVKRKSKILHNDRMIDYPLRPKGAITGLGPLRSVYALMDYIYHRHFYKINNKDLESWVIKNFGKTLYTLYFKDYTEKVWGQPPQTISQDWISKRIQGLSLSKAILDMFKKSHDQKTLTDEFLYPRYGIGQIAKELEKQCYPFGEVLKDSSVLRVFHNNQHLEKLTILTEEGIFDVKITNCISTIPITTLVKLLYPEPPADIIDAVNKLSYRDLIIVVLFYDEDRITDLTWLYFPDRKVPFGRLHEPKYWSEQMAPAGKTHLVVEFFCSENDNLWAMTDREIISITETWLKFTGITNRVQHSFDAQVLRVKNAYPVFDIHYKEMLIKVLDYLKRFRNLNVGGRTGGFSYLNMDEAMNEGLRMANNLIEAQSESIISNSALAA